MAFEKEIFAHLRELTDLVFFKYLPTRFACLVSNFSNACLRAALAL